MSRKSQIKAIIDANIKRNGRKEITGPVLNAILNAMLDAGVIDITQDGQILPKDEDGNVEIPSISLDGVVRYDVAQLLTDSQKALARNNIDAPSNADRADLAAAIVAENERAELAETELGNSVLAETERATQAESELSSRIDTIVQGRNVRDIVANYDELLAYDTSTLGDNDIIMVLLDSTKSGHTTYYKWHADTQSWEFIGGLAFTYTKTEIDEKFRALHIVIPDIPEAAVEHPEEYQELLAQVDSLVRSAGADASFRMPIDTIGNVDVTFVKSNPAHIYLGIFADDRSVLYTINRTTSQPRSYSVEIVTKEFVTRAEFDTYSEGVAQELDVLQTKVDGIKVKTATSLPATNVPADNTIYNLDEVALLVVAGTPTDNKMGVVINFHSGSSATQLQYPAATKWNTDADPTIDADADYQLTILDGVFAIAKISTLTQA